MINIELIFCLLAGCLLGIITGLTPGIHINLVAVIVLSLSPWLLQVFSPLSIALIIVGMTIVHTFLDSIPAIFLGAPTSDEILSVLPGHRLLLEGRGYEAVIRTVVGTVFAVIVMIMLAPLLIIFVDNIYPFFKEYMSVILVGLCCLFIVKEQGSKIWACTIFLLAGVLGIITLTLGLKDPLFPLFAGLFGTAGLLLSIQEKANIPPQQLTPPKITKKEGCTSISTAILAGSVCSMLPGIGPAQAATVGSLFTRINTAERFLIVNSALNMVNMMMAFITLYVIDKGRNGAIVVMGQILGGMTKEYLITIMAAVLVATGVGTLLALYFAKTCARWITKVNYQKIGVGIMIFVTALVIYITGIYGLLIYSTATALGLLPPLKKICRSHLMGSLLVPIILFLIL